MQMTFRLRFVAFFLVVLLSCCCEKNVAMGQLPRILGGQATDDFPAVGIVGSLRRGGFCSGTLVTSNHVLTAAHCAEVIDGATSGTFEVNGRKYETINVFIHPDFNSRTYANDIAILQLGEPVTGIEPSQIFREAPLVGDFLTIVGFGATGTPADGSDGSFGTKRFGFTTIDEVTATLVNWEFDDPNENNTAPGDSGGPGYLDIDGDLFIACITSGGTEPDAGLGDLAFNTRVDAYADWIDDTILFSTLAEEDEPTDDEPDDEPSDDESTDDEPPTADPVDESDCQFAIGDRPFPLLQLLIHFLWALLQLLDDDSMEDSGAALEPAPPAAPAAPAAPEVPVEPEVIEPPADSEDTASEPEVPAAEVTPSPDGAQGIAPASRLRPGRRAAPRWESWISPNSRNRLRN